MLEEYQEYIQGDKAFIPFGVSKIEEEAFSNCTELTSIEIPNSVTSIGKGAFSDCAGLTGLEIPNSVTSIEDGALWGCTGLTSFRIPNSVTSIGKYVFSCCNRLKEISLLNEDPYLLSITEDTFERVDPWRITLLVPVGTGYAYRHHPIFGQFKEVKAILR